MPLFNPLFLVFLPGEFHGQTMGTEIQIRYDWATNTAITLKGFRDVFTIKLHFHTLLSQSYISLQSRLTLTMASVLGAVVHFLILTWCLKVQVTFPADESLSLWHLLSHSTYRQEVSKDGLHKLGLLEIVNLKNFKDKIEKLNKSSKLNYFRM